MALCALIGSLPTLAPVYSSTRLSALNSRPKVPVHGPLQFHSFDKFDQGVVLACASVPHTS
jgi:hypothetical protein